MLVSERGIAADCATPRAPAVPADLDPILIARADLSRTPPARHTACDAEHAAARRGRRGGLARRSPSRRRAVAHGSERRSLARPGAPRRMAGGAGRARILDVQTGHHRRVTV